jgi:23S rRNA pseudouridine1911/1915/1917 synthase
MEPPVTVFCVGNLQDGLRLDHFLKDRIPALSRRRVQQAIVRRVVLLRAAGAGGRADGTSTEMARSGEAVGALIRDEAHRRRKGTGADVGLPTCTFPLDQLPGWLREARPDPRRTARPATAVRAGDRVVIWPERPVEPEESWDVPVLYSDAHVVAVDKPAGLVVHSTRRRLRNTLVAILRRRGVGEGSGEGGRGGEEEGLVLAHRIDRETSGVVLLARDPLTARRLSDAFAAGEVRKTYRAIVRGVPRPRGAIDRPVGRDLASGIFVKRAVVEGGAPALTEYEVERAAGEFSLLRLRPHTGRRHQIRVHLEAIGHPIVGDKLYGGDPRWYVRALERGESEAMRRALLASRQLLHAAALDVAHPATGAPLRLEAPLPADMAAFLREHTR